MTIKDKIKCAYNKANQAECRKQQPVDDKNVDQRENDHMKKHLIGELFLKHFPLLLEYDLSTASEEDYAALESFVESLAESHRCYQKLEDRIFKAYDL